MNNTTGFRDKNGDEIFEGDTLLMLGVITGKVEQRDWGEDGKFVAGSQPLTKPFCEMSEIIKSLEEVIAD